MKTKLNLLLEIVGFMIENINICVIGMGKMDILQTGIINNLDGANLKGVAEKKVI